MSSKKKTTKKGKRYTDAEKAEILDFVNKVNSEKGRGGQSSASKKFKISPLTISSWLKASGKAPKKRGRKPGTKTKRTATRVATGGSIDKKLAKLQALHKKIAASESALDKLRADFDALKNSL